MKSSRLRPWIVALALGAALPSAPARAGDPPSGSSKTAAEELAEANRLDGEVLRLYQAGKYEEALALAERCVEIRERLLAPETPEIGLAVHNLAMLYKEMGDPAKAEPQFLRAIHIFEKLFGPDHLNVSRPLGNLGLLYGERGDYARAQPYLERALKIRERELGPDDLSVAMAVGNLATVYFDKGDYARAQALFERSLSIYEKNDRDDPEISTALNNLSMVYQARGDYERAKSLLERAMRICEKLRGAEHPAVGLYNNNMGTFLQQEGKLTEAEPYQRRALEIFEKVYGPSHPDVATALANLGALYRVMGDYSRAAPLLERALHIREDKLGLDHLDFAVSLVSMGQLYWLRGEFERAEAVYERAVRILEKKLDPSHPTLATYLGNLAAIYVSRRRVADAIRAEERSLAIEERDAALVLAAGSERQKRAFMDTLGVMTSRSISMHVQVAPNDPHAATLAVSTILRRKGRVLDALTDSLAALRLHLKPEDKAIFERLSDVRSQIGAALFRGVTQRDPTEYKNTLTRLSAERESLEEDLGKRSAAFRTDQAPIRLTQVTAAIPEAAALIEIIRYDPFFPKPGESPIEARPERYVAYVLRRSGEPSFVDLGEANPINAAVQKFRAALSDPDLTHDPKPAAQALDALVMRPIAKLLGDTRWILLSPDDALNLVPFEALVDEAGRYRIERFSFSYLASGRDLLRLDETAAPRQGALIFGDPDFGAFDDKKSAAQNDGADAGRRGLRSVDMSRARFSPLSSTGKEALAVASALSDADVKLAAEATEAAVKAVAGPRILHLATHGFFLPPEPATKIATGSGARVLEDATPLDLAASVRRENPLLRAGLAFAGANMRASGANDDGILTALEASGLDLYGTKLVVLSACETGIGDTVSGEGVYGLRRALTMAGAEAQVMSLWEVESGATRELMKAYYERLKAGGGRGEALRQVKLAMLAREETSHPNLWASFIASGDWRTLEGQAAAPDLTVRPGPRGCACYQAGDGGRADGLFAALSALALFSLRRRRARSSIS